MAMLWWWQASFNRSSGMAFQNGPAGRICGCGLCTMQCKLWKRMAVKSPIAGNGRGWWEACAHELHHEVAHNTLARLSKPWQWDVGPPAGSSSDNVADDPKFVGMKRSTSAAEMLDDTSSVKTPRSLDTVSMEVVQRLLVLELVDMSAQVPFVRTLIEGMQLIGS